MQWLPTRPVERLVLLLGLGAAAVCLGVHLDGHAFHWLTWGDRDLMRAAGIDGGMPNTGAEIQFGDGVRIPGGAYYYLLAVPLLVSPDPIVAWRFVAGLELVGALVITAWAWRTRGPVAAALTAGLLTTLGGWVDAQAVLWNPTLLPAFLGVLWVSFERMHRERSWRGLWAWAAAAAIGAQLHLSVLPVAGLMLLALAVGRAPGILRAAPGAVAAILLCYAPHLWFEATHGWPNTTGLLGPVATSPPPPERMSQNLPQLAGYLAQAVVPDGALAASSRWLRYLPWLGLAGLWRADRTARASAAVALAAALLMASNTTLDMRPTGTGRYVIAFAPGLALALGAGWSRAPRGAALVPALVAALAAFGALREVQRPNLRHWDQFSALVSSAAETAGWTVPELTRRAAILKPDAAGRWSWKGADATDWWLHRLGEAPGGSDPPPCALILVEHANRDGGPYGLDGLRRTMGRPLPHARILDERSFGDGDRLVLYDPGELRCPASFGTRYVRTPAERAVEQTRRRLVDLEVLTTQAEDGADRWITWLPSHRETADQVSGRFGIAVDVASVHGRAAVTLHANALRGRSWSSGSQMAAFVKDVRLELLDPTGEVVAWPLADAPVGPDGALTPLRATFDLPTSPVAIDLVVTVRGGLDENDLPGAEAVDHPYRVRLTPAWRPR